MGGTAWSDEEYAARATTRAATGAPVFSHHVDVAAGKAKGVHPSLDPARKNKATGTILRDARDSTEHPESKAVAVLFDVTGSMDRVPSILQQNLPKLMGLLIRKNYLKHPAILIGAIGDATCDRYPLQIGNFESGIEIENDLTNIILEGGGGGQMTESYELAMYFMARHTALDCLEKRGQRGYLFIVGDEMPYKVINKMQVENLIGDKIQDNISTKDIVKELTKLYEVYFVLPHMTSNWENPAIMKAWVELFGQRTLHLENPETICELIGATIGLAEESVDMDAAGADMAENGLSADMVKSVKRALVPVMANRSKAISVPSSDEEAGVEKV